MKFGVITCPRCKQVKGVDLLSKTTRCIRCGKTLEIKKLKIFYETDSQEKLRQAIGLLNAELAEKSAKTKKLTFDE
jgi:phage FluMu protein Com